jgi:hypothetical protein
VNNITSKGSQYIAEWLPNNSNLEELNLSGMNMIRFAHQSAGNEDIGDSGAISIFNSMKDHSKLHTLWIRSALLCIVHFDISSDIGMSTVGAMKLSQTIPSLKSLKNLSVRWNPMGVEGAELILQSLSNTSQYIHLEELYLSSNDL